MGFSFAHRAGYSWAHAPPPLNNPDLPVPGVMGDEAASTDGRSRSSTSGPSLRTLLTRRLHRPDFVGAGVRRPNDAEQRLLGRIGVQPLIESGRIDDRGLARVDVREFRGGLGGDDGERLNGVPFAVPALPERGEGGNGAVGHGEEAGDLAPPSRTHSNHPSAGTRQRRDLNALRNAGFESTVSARALISLEPIFMSLAQKGIRPQRRRETVRAPSASRRHAAKSWVGAPFQRGRMLSGGTSVSRP